MYFNAILCRTHGFSEWRRKGWKGLESHVVEKRYKDTLNPIIKTSVEKGCKVYSGCWRANNSLKERTKVSNITYTVNHCQHFKADDDTSMKEIEGVWSLVKLKIKSMIGVLHDKIKSILDKFTYWQRYCFSNDDVFNKLMFDITRQKMKC